MIKVEERGPELRLHVLNAWMTVEVTSDDTDQWEVVSMKLEPV